MKKIMKLSKILLLFATVFSYLSSPIAVLADEISSIPVSMTFTHVDEDSDGYVDYYMLTYKCQNEACDVEKDYTIELEATYTYNDDTTETEVEESISVDGNSFNTVEGSYKLYSSNSISKYYNYTYSLDIAVLDGNDTVYEDEFVYNYNTLVGLTGKLNDVEATVELLGSTTVGNYDVTEEGIYTQYMSVLTGELSPNGMYRFVYGEGEEITYSEVMTGEELRGMTIAGTESNLNGKLAGTYSYTDTVSIEEISGNETDGYEVVNSYAYDYDATITYGTNNDELFSNIYGILFENGYALVNAKGLYETENVITIGDLVLALSDTTINLEVLEADGNALDLSLDEVLASEVKNGYTINFTNGATASYVVVVRGDANSDNFFNTEDLTNEELTGVMDEYINNEEVNMPSMDMVTLEEEVEGSLEIIREEFGTITFDDILFANKLLRDNTNNSEEIEDDIVVENTGLVLSFGNVEILDEYLEVTDELFVGNTLRVQVLVNSSNSLDYIDGIDGLITTSDNLRLSNIEFNENYVGTYNMEGRLVGVGTELVNGTVLMTLEFTTVGDGDASIELSGDTAKSLVISEFETITMEDINILRKSSVNNLSSLNASVGTFDIEFDKDVTVYTLTVSHDTESVILSGGLEDIYSSVTGLIEYELTEDKTTAIITVTAEDGSTKVYTVYIVKESAPVVSTPVVYYYSSNNFLKSLVVDNYEIEFDKYTSEYKITVGSDVASLDISALAEDSSARVEITGNEGFKEGENIVTITVTAENGSTREYKLVVTKEEKQKQQVTTTVDDSSNTAEKVVIIVLIILVVLGLLYLIFKKDDEEEVIVKEEKYKNSKNNNNKNKKK